MGFPIATIISTVTPLVLKAVDLMQKRREEKEAHTDALSPDALRTRLAELEDSDLEQTRLITELSRNVEALAKAVQSAQDEARTAQRQLRTLLWAALGLGVAALGVALWAVAR